MNIDKHKIMKECIHHCPLFIVTMDGMECLHPYFLDKPTYDCMIISQTDYGRIPDKCPLRKEDLTETTHYSVIV